MAITETQQLRTLERLREAGEQPVTLDQLRAGGIDFPAVVIGELELNGYLIERVDDDGRMVGVRLLETETAAPPTSRRRSRWRRPQRWPPTQRHRRRRSFVWSARPGAVRAQHADMWARDCTPARRARLPVPCCNAQRTRRSDRPAAG